MVPFVYTSRVRGGHPMREVNVREARSHLSELLDAAERGQEIIIVRSGARAARLVPVVDESARPISRAALRALIAPASVPAASTIRAMRDEERA